ncbi:MAG: leucine-rich repeat protein, partial [Eubacteriales bacterium]|nr:leucine-rich repeat protein [Eubacteriales bacterium]
VSSIGSNAFARCNSLESAYIPSTISHLGANVFRSANNLEAVHYAGSEAEWVQLNGPEQVSANTTVTFGR